MSVKQVIQKATNPMKHSTLRRDGDTKDEAQRFAAQYSARPVVTTSEQVNTLAKDMMIAIERGDTTEARRIALEIKPFFWMLREGN